MLIAFVVSAPLVLRTRFPLSAWAVSAAALVFTSLVIPPGSIGGPDIPLAGALVYGLCLYAVTVRCRPRIVVAAGAVTVAGAAFIDPGSMPQAVFLIAVPILIGVVVRVRRHQPERVGHVSPPCRVLPVAWSINPVRTCVHTALPGPRVSAFADVCVVV